MADEILSHAQVLENTEKTLDLLDETIDDVVEVMEVVRNNPVVLALVGVTGLVVGGGVGYFIAAKRLTKQFDEALGAEIEQTKEFYSLVNKTGPDGENLSPKDVLIERHGEEAAILMTEAADALRGYEGRDDEDVEIVPAGEPHDEIVDEEHIRKMEASINVFRDDTFDLEEESKHRTADKPYIITHDEFFEARKDYENHRVTYYEIDDTLTDEHDKPIEEVGATVGEDHLVRFGSGSKDPNIVYVRNDTLEIDYEIVRSTGSYLEEVLGIPNDEPGTLKHSDQRDRRRAFRHGDG